MCDAQYNDAEVENMAENEQLLNFITELKRGTLTLMVLGCLKEPYYGYALLQVLQDEAIDIEANTLYPLLRRLEAQGLLNSDWDTAESRPRKYYRISKQGEEIYRSLREQWQLMQTSVEKICKEDRDYE